MASKKERESLRQAAEDGDSFAAKLLRDVDEEDGLVKMRSPVRGEWVMVFTAMHYYCGQLLGEDHEYYALAPNCVLVYDTGPLDKFYGEGVCTHCEKVPTLHWVRKGPTVCISLWPFKRVPTPTQESR